MKEFNANYSDHISVFALKHFEEELKKIPDAKLYHYRVLEIDAQKFHLEFYRKHKSWIVQTILPDYTIAQMVSITKLAKKQCDMGMLNAGQQMQLVKVFFEDQLFDVELKLGRHNNVLVHRMTLRYF
ncbi:MAG: hypothetical protein EOP49_10710 [Sphingobacteriales bacterium]|nr:MAG: hypothetical protein EOP49_10710 [Sphingobacteriales bacterium]